MGKRRRVNGELKLNWKFANCKGSWAAYPFDERGSKQGGGHSGRASKIRREQWNETSPGEQTPGHLNRGILEKRFLEVDPRGPSNFDRKVCIGPTRAASFAGSFVTSSFQLFSPSSSSSCSFSLFLSVFQPPFSRLFALSPFFDRCMYVSGHIFLSSLLSFVAGRDLHHRIVKLHN